MRCATLSHHPYFMTSYSRLARSRSERFRDSRNATLCVAPFLDPHSSCPVLHHDGLAIEQSRGVLLMLDAMKSKGLLSDHLHRRRGQAIPAQCQSVQGGTQDAIPSTHLHLWTPHLPHASGVADKYRVPRLALHDATESRNDSPPGG